MLLNDTLLIKIIRDLLVAIIVLTPVQIYILPVYGFYLSASLALSLALVFFLSLTQLHMRIKLKLNIIYFMTSCLVLLIVLQLLSLSWSTDMSMGYRVILYEIFFIATVYACMWLLMADGKSIISFRGILSTSLIIMGSVSLLCYFLVLAQNIDPSLRKEFLHSDWAKIFINPNTVDFLRSKSWNSYILPDKRGGFFVNANVASGYFGLCTIILWWVYRCATSKATCLGALLLVIFLISGVYFSGSKAGLVLAVMLPTLAIFLKAIKNAHASKQNKLTFLRNIIKYLTFILSTFAAWAIWLYWRGWDSGQVQNFTQKIDSAFSGRIPIWRRHVKSALEEPFSGQGFGNFTGNLPPHNTLVYLWSQSGMFAMLLGALFMISVLWLAVRLFMMPDKKSEDTGLALGLIASWLFIHGMGTNWGLIGEEHQYVIFALMLGIACAQYEKVKQDPKTQVQARVASGS